MSLKDRIAGFKTRAEQQMPADVLGVMRDATNLLKAAGLRRRAVPIGARAPDFTLANGHGERVSLAGLLARGAVVLSFYRGGWCPYCNLELKALGEAQDEIEAQGGILVAVSPETPDRSLTTSARNALRFEVLSDAGSRVSDAYGLTFELDERLRGIYAGWGIDLPAANDDPDWKLPVPGTFVIDRDGVVRFAYVDEDYTRRMEPADIVDALRQIAAGGRQVPAGVFVSN